MRRTSQTAVLTAAVALLLFTVGQADAQSGYRSSGGSGARPSVPAPTPAYSGGSGSRGELQQPSDFGGGGGGSGTRTTPSASDGGSPWAVNDPGSTVALDHAPWDRFLAKYTTTDDAGLNRVCYGDVTCGDHKRVKRYLGYLQSIDPGSLNRAEQMAYWFNVYNAQMVDIVLDNYRVRSVLKIKEDLFDLIGPFNDKVLTINGQRLSLSDVENEIVRPVYGDPRIHYALNCASVGCPNLKKTAWRGETLDDDLDQAAYTFINSGRAVKVKPLGRLWASKIYDWYQEDFGGGDKALVRHWMQYAKPELRAELRGRCKVDRFSYNWSLNGCGHHNFSWVNLLLPSL